MHYRSMQATSKHTSVEVMFLYCQEDRTARQTDRADHPILFLILANARDVAIQDDHHTVKRGWPG